MKIVLNLIVLALIAGLAYALVGGIQEPIKFKDEYNKRKEAVTGKMEQIRKTQEIYREITGEFAGSFDTLAYVLSNDSIPFVRLEADPDDPTKREIGLPTLIQSFEKMKKLNIKKVYPGHYEAFENINTVINNQLERIEKRLAETHQLIAKGSNTYDDLFGIVYANRMSFPAAVMMIGYLDELEERELIKKEMTSQGIYTFITS